jgi:GNAT superfamily N-acetyltransferase
MFRIRRIYDSVLPIDKESILQVQYILRSQFIGVSEKEIAKLPEKLDNPLKYRFRSILFVADDTRGRVKGFALVSHEPVLNFAYLDFISTTKFGTGRGIGGIIYERIREEALPLKVFGLFYECLPDDPKLCRSPEILKQNAKRLRFYERYGARPIVHTAYETPVIPGDDCPPYLVFDGLGQDIKLRRDAARSIVRAILERKYGSVCPPDYVTRVVESFKDSPVRLREPRYIKKEQPVPQKSLSRLTNGLCLSLMINILSITYENEDMWNHRRG